MNGLKGEELSGLRDARDIGDPRHLVFPIECKSAPDSLRAA